MFIISINLDNLVPNSFRISPLKSHYSKLNGRSGRAL